MLHRRKFLKLGSLGIGTIPFLSFKPAAKPVVKPYKTLQNNEEEIKDDEIELDLNDSSVPIEMTYKTSGGNTKENHKIPNSSVNLNYIKD